MGPVFPRSLSSNHTVIAFDSRGVGNTTIGSKPYTYQQLANDPAGLLDALKIPKADVMGYSLGSYIAQQLTIMYPDKVNTLTLVGSSCGGKDHTPKPPEFLKLQSEIVNKSLNNVSIWFFAEYRLLKLILEFHFLIYQDIQVFLIFYLSS